MAAKNEFSFCENSHVTKIWKKKNTFPKEFFNMTQSKRTWIHLHLWNKIWKKKKLFCFKMATKISFVILDNKANLC